MAKIPDGYDGLPMNNQQAKAEYPAYSIEDLRRVDMQLKVIKQMMINQGEPSAHDIQGWTDRTMQLRLMANVTELLTELSKYRQLCGAMAELVKIYREAVKESWRDPEVVGNSALLQARENKLKLLDGILHQFNDLEKKEE